MPGLQHCTSLHAALRPGEGEAHAGKDARIATESANLPISSSAPRDHLPVMNTATSPLLTDLYQLNMIQAYLDHGDTQTAVFEFFVRTMPARRVFFLAAGLH